MSDDTRVTIDPHPLLDAATFVADYPRPQSECPTPDKTWALLQGGGPSDLASTDAVRAAIRDLLRHGGFKPTGRSKPASEYLLKAVAEGTLSRILPAVDVCNVVSHHTGLPISVVDLSRTRGPLRIGVAPPETTYVFNASGQTIDVGGLLCLFDADGPCANAVKDAQRTKTTPETTRTLCVVWGTTALPGRTAAVTAWYLTLLRDAGVRCS